MEEFSLRKFSGHNEVERKQGGGGGSDDEFFDLKFAVPVESGHLEEFNTSVSSSGFRFSSSTSLTEEIMFNGRLVEPESSSTSPSLFFSPAASEPNSKSQFLPVLKSAAKFRVFMFRFMSSASSVEFIKEERKLYKDIILRYIDKIKPLYVKVSKLRFYGAPGRNYGSSAGQGAGVNKQSKATGSSLHYRFNVVSGRLRKSRSEFSAVASVVSPPTMTPRWDDSLLLHEDGIQGAIAHCKRSFHSEKGLWTNESPFLRSMSDPGEERSISHGRSSHGRSRVISGEDFTA
ncbi:hypothetical protein KSP39_PZI011517 [Platanthera zijinensis]|uniref:Membrane-associated kinase regulator n=1 Tax=Platanthera zijinensis TaxID=2320716 RepID=A0AAP0BGF6_9ASPA